MKQLFNLLWFVLLFSLQTLSAQNNILKLDLMHFSVAGVTLDHAGLEYFHTFGNYGQVGIKIMHTTDAIANEPYEATLSLSNLDLVHRWCLNKLGKRIALSAEAGISVAHTIERLPPLKFSGILPVGPNQIQTDFLPGWQIKREFGFGITGAFNAEYRFSALFSIGLGVLTNVYLMPKNQWAILPLPQLKTAFSF